MVGVLVRYRSDYSNILVFTPLDVKGELVAVRVALHRLYPTKKRASPKKQHPFLINVLSNFIFLL